jgi:hypothetical protein
MAFFSSFLRLEGHLNPATFTIPQVATRYADAVNLRSKNASVRRAPEVQKVQLIGSRRSPFDRFDSSTPSTLPGQVGNLPHVKRTEKVKETCQLVSKRA